MDEIPEAIVFDVDGTLVNSIRQLYRSTARIFRLCRLPKPSFREYCAEFGAPYMDFYRRRGVRASDEQIWQWHNEKMATFVPDLFDDVSPVLELLHKTRFPLGVVSGQRTVVLQTLFQQYRIDHLFSYVRGDQEDKVPALRRFCRSHRLCPSSVWYVGDFVSDMVHARQAGLCPIGITRGNHTIRVLKRAGARRCITHLSELLPLLKVSVQHAFR